MKATRLLEQDHAAVKKLFARFERTTPRAEKLRKQLVRSLAAELDTHARIEEEIFYPAMQKVRSAASMLREARAEHGDVKSLVAEMQALQPADEALTTIVRDLKRAVLHHATEEERAMFPLAETELGKDALTELGERLRAAKTRPRTRRPARRAA